MKFYKEVNMLYVVECLLYKLQRLDNEAILERNDTMYLDGELIDKRANKRHHHYLKLIQKLMSYRRTLTNEPIILMYTDYYAYPSHDLTEQDICNLANKYLDDISIIK